MFSSKLIIAYRDIYTSEYRDMKVYRIMICKAKYGDVICLPIPEKMKGVFQQLREK